MSLIESIIASLREREMKPGDPRTPSVGSVPGMQLSLENERKLYEAQLRQQHNFEALRRQAEEARRQYWSDPEHLAEKLGLFTVLCPTESFSIIKGTGDVVIMKEVDGEENYYYVDIIEGELYVSQARYYENER